MTALAHLVTAFFRHHLAVEKGVSKNTIATYSYAFKFLCGYVSGRLGKSPSELSLEDLDAPMVRAFLEHLARRPEHGTDTEPPLDRHPLVHEVRRVRGPLCARAGPQDPRHLEQAHRGAPRQPPTKEEMRALLDAPDPRTHSGIRDQAMLYLGFAAGLRVSELVGLRLDDIELDGPYPSILVRGKGRQHRRLPLWKEATRALRAWVAVRGDARVPEVFLNVRGEALTCSGFTHLVKEDVRVAMPHSPGLSGKRVSPHGRRGSAGRPMAVPGAA